MSDQEFLYVALAPTQSSNGVEQLEPVSNCRDVKILQGLVYLIVAECGLYTKFKQPRLAPLYAASALSKGRLIL